MIARSEQQTTAGGMTNPSQRNLIPVARCLPYLAWALVALASLLWTPPAEAGPILPPGFHIADIIGTFNFTDPTSNLFFEIIALDANGNVIYKDSVRIPNVGVIAAN